MANVSPPRSIFPPYSSARLHFHCPTQTQPKYAEAPVTCSRGEAASLLPGSAVYMGTLFFFRPLPLVQRQLSIFAASSLRRDWGDRCSLENGAERSTPHSNSIEPRSPPIGWNRSGLRAADWPLKMHSRMMSRPTRRSAQPTLNSLGPLNGIFFFNTSSCSNQSFTPRRRADHYCHQTN